MGTTNRIPDKCNHTQTCIQSRILFFSLSLPKSESKENTCTVSFNPFIPWTSQVITRKLCLLSSSIFPKFLVLCLVFLLFPIYPAFRVIIVPVKIPVNGAIKSLISRPAYRAPRAFDSYQESYSPILSGLLGVLFSSSARIFMTGQSSFVLGKGSSGRT